MAANFLGHEGVMESHKCNRTPHLNDIEFMSPLTDILLYFFIQRETSNSHLPPDIFNNTGLNL